MADSFSFSALVTQHFLLIADLLTAFLLPTAHCLLPTRFTLRHALCAMREVFGEE